jgi:hypothetical protein
MPFLTKAKIDNKIIFYYIKITSLAIDIDKLNKRVIEKINML